MVFVKALIVDDEPLARQRLRRLLEGLHVEVVGECTDGLAALSCGDTPASYGRWLLINTRLAPLSLKPQIIYSSRSPKTV